MKERARVNERDFFTAYFFPGWKLFWFDVVFSWKPWDNFLISARE
jgi:hypothetical protein